MSSHVFFMFSAIYRYITKTGGCVKELSLGFQNRIEKFLLVRFLLMLLFRLIVEKLSICGQHCNASANTQDYELKISIHINFNTLMSNLKSYFQYGIDVTSL